MEKTKKDFIKNIIVLSILCALNLFLILVSFVPSLTIVKEGLNLILSFVYFAVIILYIAIINVDALMRRKEKKRYITIPILSAVVLGLGIIMLIFLV